MAGVTNNTARQFNLKCVCKNCNRVTVRIAPGFNVVEDAHWQEFVSKDGKHVDPYVATLKKQGFLAFGKTEDEKELEVEPDTKSKSKSIAIPKVKKVSQD